MTRKQRAKLATARAYYRNAAKAERAGNYRQAQHWRDVADRFVRMDQRDREAMARAKAARRLA